MPSPGRSRCSFSRIIRSVSSDLDVVLRRVDRIDNPSPRGLAADSEFFADDAVAGPLALQFLADHPLRFFVGGTDGSAVCFRPHRERRRAKPAHRDRIRGVGEIEREFEVAIHAAEVNMRAVRVVLIVILLAFSARGQEAVLRWGGDSEGGAPYVEADPNDPANVEGFDVEVASAMAKGLGRTPQFVQVAWASIDQSVARGDFDIGMSGVEDTRSE